MTLTPQQVKEQLVAAVDQAIEKGSWDSSLFLKNILKQLHELRAYIVQELGDGGEQSVASTSMQQLQRILQEREGYQRAYITVYQADSGRLDRWFNALKMLAAHSMSRPAYSSEQDVQNMIREKQSKSDAYVIVWVKESDILPSASGIPLKDRWNHPLLTLKEGSFKLENVIAFVHDRQRYRLTEQSLVLLAE